MDNIKTCKCKHEFQDKEYGQGMRVHNKTTKGSRCSVCGTERNEGGKK